MKDHLGALLFAVAAFVVFKVVLKLFAPGETLDLLLSAVAAGVIGGLFTRHVRRRAGRGQGK